MHISMDRAEQVYCLCNLLSAAINIVSSADIKLG